MSITATRISKRFGTVVALDDVSVDVPDQSLTALLGPSGGGKSTLLRVLAGLERPDAGTVRIAGADVTGVPVRERSIGFVFQHYAAFRHLTVADNVGFALAVRRRPKKEIRARVEELLALVRLDGLAGRYPAQLSGGQRQRMALARALAAEPRVLLLDEPFGALDAAIRAELREWLRRLHEQVPVTTIVVTHDQEEALELADQIVLVHRGRIEQAGSPSDLYHRPASPFVMSFIGASTRLHGAWHRPHDIDLTTEGGARRARRGRRRNAGHGRPGHPADDPHPRGRHRSRTRRAGRRPPSARSRRAPAGQRGPRGPPASAASAPVRRPDDAGPGAGGAPAAARG